MEALTNLLTQRLPSCFSKREKKKFLSWQVSPGSLFILQNKRFLLKKKKTRQGTAFLRRKSGSFVSETKKNRRHYWRKNAQRRSVFFVFGSS